MEQHFRPLLVDAARPARHPVGGRWFVDETYMKTTLVVAPQLTSFQAGKATSTIEIAGRDVMFTVPREPRPTERWATVSLPGASTTVRKIVRPQNRILLDDLASDGCHLVIHGSQPLKMLLKRPSTTLGRQGAQENVFRQVHTSFAWRPVGRGPGRLTEN